MTLPQVVQDAVSEVDAWLSGEPVHADFQTIRAELRRLTEIAEGIVPFQVRLGEAATKLERANAEISKYRASLGAIHCMADRVHPTVIRSECEHCIPELVNIAHLSEPRT